VLGCPDSPVRTSQQLHATSNNPGHARSESDSFRVYDFRALIQSLTSVPPVRQKLIGLSKGKLSTDLDAARFGTLGVKRGCKFTMIGTPEELSFKDPSEVDLPEVGTSSFTLLVLRNKLWLGLTS
jgi:ubiquitin-like domain-containing CTD phosphatase 1